MMMAMVIMSTMILAGWDHLGKQNWLHKMMTMVISNNFQPCRIWKKLNFLSTCTTNVLYT